MSFAPLSDVVEVNRPAVFAPDEILQPEDAHPVVVETADRVRTPDFRERVHLHRCPRECLDEHGVVIPKLASDPRQHGSGNDRYRWKEEMQTNREALDCIRLSAGPLDAIPVALINFLVARGVTPLAGERTVFGGRPGLKKALNILAESEEPRRSPFAQT